MSKVYHPKTKKRKKKHGFLKRTRSKAGSSVVSKRRQKGRHKLTV
ncbi:MAG: 50S ribosomal protein L34 [Patescibacteria group bacterium]